MDELLNELLEFKNAISYNGWIILPPSPEGELRVRVEWYLAEKHAFEANWSCLNIKKSNINLAKVFIDNANRYIEDVIARQN
ncbi:MAG: hypothetical protein OEY89_17380 [Gammaproteobacteria bacterium]|nr:hypothetical protein [Gammaproteobacteria bacterium]